MRQSPYGDKIDAALGITAYRIEGNAARRLRLATVVYDGHRFTSLLGCEVVKHNTVYTTHAQGFAQLIHVTHFYLYLQLLAFLFEIFMGTTDSVFNAAGKIHVVVFEQNHIEKAYAVVHTPAYLDSLFFQHAHSGRCLAGIEYPGTRSLYRLHITSCHSGDTAHALHDVEHRALYLQERLHLTLDNKSHIAGLYLGTVFNVDSHLQLGVEILKHAPCYLYAGQYAGLFDKEFLASHFSGRDATQSSMVAVTYIFGKSESYKLIYKLLRSFHLNCIL